MVREVLNENQMQLMTNPPCGGILYLREAIATYLKEFRGMTVLPEQIIIDAGTEYLYGLLIQLSVRIKFMPWKILDIEKSLRYIKATRFNANI